MKLNDKTETCKNCQDPIRVNSDGVWVTATAKDFDLCNGETVHEPTPETAYCEGGCGYLVAWNYDENERWCASCTADSERQARDQEWDYRQ